MICMFIHFPVLCRSAGHTAGTGQGLSFGIVWKLSSRRISGPAWLCHSAGGLIRTGARAVHTAIFHGHSPFCFFVIRFILCYKNRKVRLKTAAVFILHPLSGVHKPPSGCRGSQCRWRRILL